MSKRRSLKRQPQKGAVEDLDPGDESTPRHEHTSSEQDSASENDGREHYQVVGKSKMRQPERLQLGSKYSGSTVNRAALDQEGDDGDDDDPFAPVDDEEDEDPFAVTEEADDNPDNADGSKRHSKSSRSNGTHRVSLPALQQHDEENDIVTGVQYQAGFISEESDDRDIIDGHDSDDMGSEISATPPFNFATSRDKLKSLRTTTPFSATTSLSAATQAHIQKGLAIRKQQSTYDRLLDARIKLQKGLNASNHLSSNAMTAEDAQELVRKAEVAALSLWQTIESVRMTILSTKQQDLDIKELKRKRSLEMPPTTSLPIMWDQSQSVEDLTMPHRRATLDKWSVSTRLVTASGPSELALTSVLDTHLSSEALNHSMDSKDPDDSFAYTDDAFYQSLLRDLINSRSQSFPPAVTVSKLPTKLHPSGSSKKSVDTRASKGRKIRYTVHEKLQNFMAPEDRTTWSEAARREFFGSLFGQRLLDEDVAESINGDGAADASAEESLRLFSAR